jgi:tricorn protease
MLFCKFFLFSAETIPIPIRMRLANTLFFALLACTFLSAQNSSGTTLLRYPALNADGSQIAFSYQGDIWVSAAEGGAARRLTIHESYESHPQWSLDDEQLLFQSNRYGNDDIFVVSASGGRPERLTYHSTGDRSARWGEDGNIFFTTRRVYAQVEREQEIWQINQSGGTPQRAMDALGLMPAPSPDGRYIAFIQGNCRPEREAYQGPANRQVWVYDTQEDEYRQITQFEGQDIYPDWGPDNTLYFLSARKHKRYNLYRVDVDTPNAKPEALTNFKDEGIRYFDVSADGKQAILEYGTQLWLMETKPNAKPKAVNVSVTGDYRFDPVERKSYSDNLSNYALSPDNKHIALNIRGELFVMPADKDQKRSARQTKRPANDQEPSWLNDSTLLFLSDRAGNYDLYLLRSADEDEPSLYRTFKRQTTALTKTPEDEMGFALSPDRKRIAIQRGRGQLIVADIDENGSLSNEKVLHDGWATPSGMSWSPDGQWLAYSMPDLNFNREIYIHAADGSKDPVNVSLHPRSDGSPVWSADGSKLGFLSDRNNGDRDVWFVWLKRADWEKTNRDWEELETLEEDKKDKKDTTELVVQIDFDDIHERLEQVTRMPGNEGDLAISEDGETFYFSTNNGGRASGSATTNFHSIKWDGSDLKTLLEDKSIGNLQWGDKGKQLYFQSRGRLSRLDVGKGKTESLAFQAEMEINHEAERKQVFHETWRALDQGFYDPQFHGRDWAALRDKYEPRALAASTTQDFRDMVNEMLGQLDASHMGLYGSDPEETQRDRTGLLGVEVKPADEGFEITYVLPESPADRTDSKLELGERITAINGQALNAGDNIYELLQGTADERTLLNVIGKDGSEREVVIRPESSLSRERYEAWVDMRKDLTERYSNGRLGYIHIQGMNWPSFERFERELMASGLGKDGIVIDVRFNGGGWTTDMLMTVLNVRQHAYTIPRGAAESLDKQHTQFRENYPYGERLPLSALTKPSIALCNENSYSNAEIFSHAYKTLDLGTLVGQPTFGAVISTGGQRLMDGSFVRMPFRAWYVKATGENMEHGPAVPDILVKQPPASKAQGEDPQLKAAVEQLLKEMER